jgi:translation elongation factor aEF-1 beta
MKILPKEAGLNINDMVESIKNNLEGDMQIVRVAEDPIAFGLSAAILDIVIEDKEGKMDELEERIKSSNFVSQIDVMGVSRFSSKI